MIAAVLTGEGRVVVVDDHPEPACGADEVLIAVRGVGICGSDLAVVTGKRTVPEHPWVLGHEAVGDIVAVGERVTGRAVGQRVAVEPNFPCMDCEHCRGGATAMCPRKRILGINEPGVLTERLAVPAAFAWPLPAHWPIEDQVCVEPFAVARAAVARVGAARGRRCLVTGAGAQGLQVCLALLSLGALPYVTDPEPGRLAAAIALGAADLAGLDDDTRFPFAIETSGAPQAFESVVERAAPDGRIALIGQSPVPAKIPAFSLVQKRLTIQGCLIYEHPGDFSAAIAAIASGAVQPGRAVHARFALADAAEAFRQAPHVAGKSWITVEPRTKETTR